MGTVIDRYISREWLLKTLEDYSDIACWNTEIMDADTIGRVLEVLKHKIEGAPDISHRQLGGKILKAKEMAMRFELESLERRMRENREDYRRMESTNNVMLMGFYKGMLVEQRVERDFLERMVQNEKGRHDNINPAD